MWINRPNFELVILKDLFRIRILRYQLFTQYVPVCPYYGGRLFWTSFHKGLKHHVFSIGIFGIAFMFCRDTDFGCDLQKKYYLKKEFKLSCLWENS
jgi:hypothetical protein